MPQLLSPGATVVKAHVPRAQCSAAGETTAEEGPRSTTGESPLITTGETPQHDWRWPLTTTRDGPLTTTRVTLHHDRRRPLTTTGESRARQQRSSAAKTNTQKTIKKSEAKQKFYLLRLKKAPGTIIHI